MTVEKVKIFQDGKWTEYKRDLSKQPLNIEDWFNATKLDVATHNYERQYDDNPMKTSSVKPYVEATLKFIVTFFKNQFTLEDAKGINPAVLHDEMENWYAQSSGVMGSFNDKEQAKK